MINEKYAIYVYDVYDTTLHAFVSIGKNVAKTAKFLNITENYLYHAVSMDRKINNRYLITKRLKENKNKTVKTVGWITKWSKDWDTIRVKIRQYYKC